MKRCAVSRRGRQAVMGALIMVALLVMAAPAEAGCVDEMGGRVLTPSEPYAGDSAPCSGAPAGCVQAPPPVGGTEIAVPAAWQGQPFRLDAGLLLPCVGCQPTNPVPDPVDFAVSWFDGDGGLLRIDDTPDEGESGAVPADASSAVVTFRALALDQAFWLEINCPPF